MGKPIPLDFVVSVVKNVAVAAIERYGYTGATFDQLAEEVIELHLSLRGKHEDPPALEWISIASIAINALTLLSCDEIAVAEKTWKDRHAYEPT